MQGGYQVKVLHLAGWLWVTRVFLQVAIIYAKPATKLATKPATEPATELMMSREGHRSSRVSWRRPHAVKQSSRYRGRAGRDGEGQGLKVSQKMVGCTPKILELTT